MKKQFKYFDLYIDETCENAQYANNFADSIAQWYYEDVLTVGTLLDELKQWTNTRDELTEQITEKDDDGTYFISCFTDIDLYDLYGTPFTGLSDKEAQQELYDNLGDFNVWFNCYESEKDVPFEDRRIARVYISFSTLDDLGIDWLEPETLQVYR